MVTFPRSHAVNSWRSAAAFAVVLILLASTAAASHESRPGYVPDMDSDSSGMAIEAFLPAEDAGHGDRLGGSVAVHGNLMAVGAPGGNGGSGYVVVYERAGNDNEWRVVNRLTSPDGAADARFGFKVIIDGVGDPMAAKILVSAPGADEGRGVVYGYTATDDLWTWRLPAPSRTATGFGHALAVHDGTLLVGAPSDGRRGEDAGAVHVFEFDDRRSSWALKGTVHAPRPEAGARFGESVAVLNGVGVIGEPGRGSGAGAAYSLHGYGTVSGLSLRASPGAELGASVALSTGDGRNLVAAVGAPGAGVVHLTRPAGQGDQPVSVMPGDNVQMVMPGDNVKHTRFGETIAFDGRALTVAFTVYEEMSDSDIVSTLGVLHAYRSDGRLLSTTALVDGNGVKAAVPGALAVHDGVGVVGLPHRSVDDASTGAALVMARDSDDGDGSHRGEPRAPPHPRDGFQRR